MRSAAPIQVVTAVAAIVQVPPRPGIIMASSGCGRRGGCGGRRLRLEARQGRSDSDDRHAAGSPGHRPESWQRRRRATARAGCRALHGRLVEEPVKSSRTPVCNASPRSSCHFGAQQLAPAQRLLVDRSEWEQSSERPHHKNSLMELNHLKKSETPAVLTTKI